MSKILLVLKNEFITTVARRSFLLAAIGVPLVSSLIFAGLSAAGRRSGVSEGVSPAFSVQSPRSPVPEGYVDESGLVRRIPVSVPQGAFIAFADRASAQTALGAGEISAYYLIPPDYLETGELVYTRPDFNPLSAMDQSTLFERVLQVNLLGGDEQLAARISYPLDLEVVSLAPELQRDQDHPLAFFLPYAVTMIYYAVILMSASFLLNSLTKEKENRVIEILMSSITPRQLLVGKIIALGLVGLLQAVLWVGTGYALLRLSGRTFSLPSSFQLPPSFLFWGAVFFLLGYSLYASLMAGVGALVPNLREASQATFVVILPLLIPLVMISVLIEDPNGPLALGLSLFPLTSPVVMMTRLSAARVPLPQLLLSAALLAITAALVVRIVAGMFRTQTLLAGQALSLKRLFALLSGRT